MHFINFFFLKSRFISNFVFIFAETKKQNDMKKEAKIVNVIYLKKGVIYNRYFTLREGDQISDFLPLFAVIISVKN